MPDCPTHKTPMLRRSTQYGPMYICTENGCDMLKWGDSSLTTVADSKTREARHAAHETFDKLWQDKHMTRNHAYNRLRKCLGLKTLDETHIGLFGIRQCEATIEFGNKEQRRILMEKFR